MIDVLLIFHFVGLALTACGGVGGIVVMSYPGALPTKRGGGLRSSGLVLSRIMLGGLSLAWPSGIGLVLVKDGAAATSSMFWMKIGFVALLTFAAVSLELTYGEIRRGNTRLGGTVLSLGPLAGLSILLALVFSVLAFH
jgi:hypothetical protein